MSRFRLEPADDPGVRSDPLERLLERSDALPLGNRAALARIVALCDEASATPAGIALEAARDEGFAALLMRLANSADSGSVTRVSELTTAVVRLGLRHVQGLALAAPGLRLLSGRRRARAALAAGLLHNIGLKVLSLCEPQLFAGVLSDIPAERAKVGITHAELGARLAERWSYPGALAEAIREHDSDTPTTGLGAVVHVADRLVRRAGTGVEPVVDPTLPALELARVANLPLAEARLEALLAAQDRFDAFQG